MGNEITKLPRAEVPARTMSLMKEWQASPKQCYDNLPTAISHSDIFESLSPTLSQIGRALGMAQATMIVALAIEDVNRMFRQERRMPPEDIAATARRIVNVYWYLKPEDIKKCFNGRRPKQFVLEGDSFLSWLGEYDLSRDNACEDTAMSARKIVDAQSGAISDKAYREILKHRAEQGDKTAQETLMRYAKIDRQRTPQQQDAFNRKLHEIKLQRLMNQHKI